MKKYLPIIIIIIIVLGLIGFFIYKNNVQKTGEKINEISEEYTPQEEISEEQLRETIVTLYFENTETNTLNPEARKIDANELIKNPYEYLINLLIQGPKNEKLKKIIPEGTKLNSANLDGEILKIDFSKEFTNEQDLNEENIINSILNTVTGLNEVNGIKILIDGEENKSFSDEKVKFDNAFYLNK